MTLQFIETFDIPGLSRIGIEDRRVLHQGFSVWAGGCGIAREINTIAEARAKVLSFALERLRDRSEKYAQDLAQSNESISRLGGFPGKFPEDMNDTFKLGQFLKTEHQEGDK